MALEVASLYTKIGADTTGLENGLTKAKSSVQSFIGVVKGIGIAIGGALVVREIAQFTGEVIKLASDMHETLSKTSVVFGEQAAGIIDWAESAALSMGMSKAAALDAASTYANLFMSMGLASDVSVVMSKNLVQLASDMGSFYNIDPTEALYKLRAGLVGEIEPLRAVGITLSAAAVEAKAMEMGLMRVGDELTAATRAQATYALILEQTSVVQGDFARTSDGLANQQRILKSTWTDLKTTMGEAFLPLATTLTTALSAAADAVGPSLENISQQIRDWSINLISNMFYWGANMVESLASGIAGSGAVVDALNQLGGYFTAMLETHSPPKLLPDLEKWGAGAAQAYLDGWVGSTPTSKGVLDKWGAALKPLLMGIAGGGSYSGAMGKQLEQQFGSSGKVLAEYVSSYSDLRDATKGVADAQKEYDEISESGDAEQIKNAKSKLDKAKDSESQAKARFSVAQSRMRAEAEAQGQLIAATRMQTQAIREQGAVLKEQAAAQVEASQKAIDSARLSWQMAQTDTKGKIALLEEESKKHEQGTVEWYQLQTQKINLENQLRDAEERAAKAAEKAGAGVTKSTTAGIKQIESLGNLVDDINKTAMPDWLDPLVMQMSAPPKNLFDLVKDLGAAMSGDFAKAFIDRLWLKLAEALGMKPEESVTDAAGRFGLAIGDVIWAGIKERLNTAFASWMLDITDKARNLSFGKGLLMPQLWANGFEGMVTRPTLALVGEAGPEYVSVTPGGRGGGGGNIYITVNTNDQGAIRKLRELGVSI